jgi:DNA repair exonuclease SbcCD nuclease subunit
MPVIFHAADIHLDSPLRGLEQYDGAPAAALRGATRRALERLVEQAIESRANLVVIAGDLYDGESDDYSTALFLNTQLDRLHQAGIEVCVIRGNHDAHSVLTRHLRMPPNVHVLSAERAETKPYDALGVAVHGQSYATRAVTENLALGYPKPIAGMFNLGILHTCVTGSEGHESYAPCSLEDLKRLGYDYWALGHVHAPALLCERPLVVMPGNLQGRHARECGPRGFVSVEVGAGVPPRHTICPIDVVRWEAVEVDVTGIGGVDALVDQAERAVVVAASRTDAPVVALRIRIVGTTPAHARIAADPDRVVNEIRSQATRVTGGRVWIEKVKLHTRSARRPDTDPGPLGTLARLVERLHDPGLELTELVESTASELRKKLPPGVLETESGPMLADQAWLEALLDRAHARLEAGLLADDEAAP